MPRSAVNLAETFVMPMMPIRYPVDGAFALSQWHFQVATDSVGRKKTAYAIGTDAYDVAVVQQDLSTIPTAAIGVITFRSTQLP